MITLMEALEVNVKQLDKHIALLGHIIINRMQYNILYIYNNIIKYT